MSILKKYEELSSAYNELHSKSRTYYSSMNTKLNVANIVVVSLIGISNNITTISDVNNKYVSIVYSIVLYFTALMSTLQQFLKYEELSEKHRVSSIRYNHLHNLCLISKEEDLKTIIKEYENIYNSAPVIPDFLTQNIKEMEKTDVLDTPEDDIEMATKHQLNRLLVQSYRV